MEAIAAFVVPRGRADPEDLRAESVAAKVGLPPEQVFKTLVARGEVVLAFGKIVDHQLHRVEHGHAEVVNGLLGPR